MRVRELIDILNDQPPDAEIELAVIAHVDDDADDITVDRWSIEAVVPWDDKREAVASEDDDTEHVAVWLVGGEDADVEAFLDAVDPDEDHDHDHDHDGHDHGHRH
jgi:hypothetical protein